MNFTDQNKLPKLLVLSGNDTIAPGLEQLLHDQTVIINKKDYSNIKDFIKEQDIDLILLDSSLSPECNTINLIKDIKNSPEVADIPLINIIDNSRKQDIIHSLIMGAEDYISDIGNTEEVFRKINSRLRLLNTRVLIAEDDEIVSDLLYNKFRNAGFKVKTSSDGFEAWNFLENNNVDLLLVDRMMSGIDGIRLLKMIKNNPDTHDIPVVFITSNRYDEEILNGFRNGVDDCIVRPFNMDEVLVRCTRLIHHNIL